MSRLPVIVSVGGYNAAGRSSGCVSYKRMIHESLTAEQKKQNIQALASLMGLDSSDQSSKSLEQAVLEGTLVRKIEAPALSSASLTSGQRVEFFGTHGGAVEMSIPVKDLPKSLPNGWEILDKQSSRVRVKIHPPMPATIELPKVLPVQSAGQLPTGFNPGSYYRSVNHPRGLQLTVMGASDAVNSLGIEWSQVIDHVRPDQVGVYSASVMSQLDEPGLGGMMSARLKGRRVTSKQLPLGLNSMPADFINAYVLGSVGVTGGITGACATFLYNLQAGVEDIKSGKRRVVLVGSSEAPILPEIIEGYSAMGALATDDELRRLDNNEQANHRFASRPFGVNCGFTLAESAQYTLLMDEELALDLGAPILGSVPGVYINADGYKRSISAPGPGNYLTMASAVSLARNLVGEERLKSSSFVLAHGSSTPQNRVSESLILDKIAEIYGIDYWPVSAIKSYVGHSLGPAAGDQFVASLGVFACGVMPGIKTIMAVADDVYQKRLNITVDDEPLHDANHIGFLNSKGFGGNNATATLLSPVLTREMIARRHGHSALTAYDQRNLLVEKSRLNYLNAAAKGDLRAIYRFGDGTIDEEKLRFDRDKAYVPGFEQPMILGNIAGYDDLSLI